MNLEHERCSELLGPLLRGELSERETALVKEHLAGCEECRAERLGLEALAGAPGVMAVSAEPLSELERARLHRAVSAALPHPRTIVPDTPKPWVARLAPYLGAAAALVLVVFGVTQMDLGGSDEDAGFSTRDEAGDGGAGRAPESLADDSAEGAVAAGSAPAPQPSFESSAGDIERSALRRFGSRQEPFRSFAVTYRVADAADLRERYLADLADAGASAGDPATIEECGRQVLSSQENAVLPAYAGYGEMEDRDVLMMGFVYTPDDTGPLDNFMLWIWPREDCSVPNEYQFGRIKP